MQWLPTKFPGYLRSSTAVAHPKSIASYCGLQSSVNHWGLSHSTAPKPPVALHIFCWSSSLPFSAFTMLKSPWALPIWVEWTCVCTTTDHRIRLTILQIYTGTNISQKWLKKPEAKDSVQARCPKTCVLLVTLPRWKTMTKGAPGYVERQSQRSNPRSLQSLFPSTRFKTLAVGRWMFESAFLAWWLRIVQLLRSKSLSGKRACLPQTLPVAPQWNYKSDQVNSWGCANPCLTLHMFTTWLFAVDGVWQANVLRMRV